MNLRKIIQDAVFSAVDHTDAAGSGVHIDIETSVQNWRVEALVHVRCHEDSNGDVLGLHVDFVSAQLIDESDDKIDPMVLDLINADEFNFYRAI